MNESSQFLNSDLFVILTEKSVSFLNLKTVKIKLLSKIYRKFSKTLPGFLNIGLHNNDIDILLIWGCWLHSIYMTLSMMRNWLPLISLTKWICDSLERRNNILILPLCVHRSKYYLHHTVWDKLNLIFLFDE